MAYRLGLGAGGGRGHRLGRGGDRRRRLGGHRAGGGGPGGGRPAGRGRGLGPGGAGGGHPAARDALEGAGPRASRAGRWCWWRAWGRWSRRPARRPGRSSAPARSRSRRHRSRAAAALGGHGEGTVKATRANAENPATRTRRLACQPWARAASSRRTRSTRSSWPGGVAAARWTGARRAAALGSAGSTGSAVAATASAAGAGARTLGAAPGSPGPARAAPSSSAENGGAAAGRRRRDAAARAAGPGDQDDQRAQVATTDLVDGGHPVLGGHVEHDHVGGLQRPALGQLAQRADAAEPVGRVQQVVEHGGQGGALGHQQHPPPMEVAGPAPPAHVPDTHLDGRLPHPNTCRHMPNGGAKPPPSLFQARPGTRRYAHRNRKLDYGGVRSRRSTSAVCSPRAGGARR